MVVNTESVVGYNNKLKKATSFMKIGVNSDLNIPVRRSAPKHNFGRGAVKLPHSGVETQETKETRVVKSKKSDSGRESGEVASEVASKAAGVASEAGAKLRAKTVSTSHENNLNVLIIIAGGLAWFLFR